MAKKKRLLRKSASLTQEQAVESFRGWWGGHWGYVFTSVLLLVVGLGGWYVWENNRENRANEAAEIYFSILNKDAEYRKAYEAIEETDIAQTTSPAKTTNAISRQGMIEALDNGVAKMEAFPETPYMASLRLLRAKYRVEFEDSQGAVEDLNWVVQSSGQDALRILALKRILRLYLQNKYYDNVVNSIIDYDFPADISANFNELLGDAYMGLGKFKEARRAYSSAIKDLYQREVPLFLRLKLQRVGGIGFTEPWQADQSAP